MPETKGFSEVNLRYAERFYRLFPKKIVPKVGEEKHKNQIVPQVGEEILPQVGAKIFMVPWNHVKCILDKCGSDKREGADELRIDPPEYRRRFGQADEQGHHARALRDSVGRGLFLQETCKKNNLDAVDAFRVFSKNHAQVCKKNYAVLMFSRNTVRFIPYDYVELIRYTGKIEAFMAAQKARKTVFLTIVSAEGLKKTGYASRVNQVVTLDDLFSY